MQNINFFKAVLYNISLMLRTVLKRGLHENEATSDRHFVLSWAHAGCVETFCHEKRLNNNVGVFEIK